MSSRSGKEVTWRLLAALGLIVFTGATVAFAQGVVPGGPIGGSTAIGSGIGPGSLPGGGTGPSYPNGTTAPAAAAPIPPGGYPPSGRLDTGPSGQTMSRPLPPTTAVPPSQYLQPRDPFDPTTPRPSPPPAKVPGS